VISHVSTELMINISEISTLMMEMEEI
jgi:hypothetical protein